MINRVLIGEVVGFLAAATGFLIFQQKTRKRVLFVKFICDLLWSLHFLLLAAYSGMAISMVGCSRDLIFLATGADKKKKKTVWLAVFLTVNVISVCFAWKNMWSICSLISGVLATIAYWNDSPTRIKLISLAVCASQITYGVAIGSYAVLFNETIAVISILLFFWRLWKRKRERREELS